MYQLDEISFIYLGLIIPILFLVFLIFRRWQKKSIRKYFDINTIKFLSPEISNSKPLLKFIIISFALLMLVISLVNPKIGTELKTVKREGVDIVFAIDVSKSTHLCSSPYFRHVFNSVWDLFQTVVGVF